MKQLESVLPPDSLCVLYDPLVDTAALVSLPQRISAGHPNWTLNKLKFWSHPLSVAARLQRMGPQAQQLSVLFQRFQVPLEIKSNQVKNEIQQEELVGRTVPVEKHNVDPNTMRVVPTQQHLKTRTEQLMCKFSAATAHYLRVRHLAVESPPAELQNPQNPQEFQGLIALYQLAASDASFWSAVCKLELHERDTAAGALQDYVRKYPRSDWTSASQYLLAMVQAERGKLAEARAAVSSLPPDDPHRPGLEILMKRWDALPEPKPAGEPKTE